MNEDDLIPVKADPVTGQPEVFYFGGPRQISFTSRIEF